MKVDCRTVEEADLYCGKIKVVLNTLVSLPLQLPKWVEGIQFLLQVDKDGVVEGLTVIGKVMQEGGLSTCSAKVFGGVGEALGSPGDDEEGGNDRRKRVGDVSKGFGDISNSNRPLSSVSLGLKCYWITQSLENQPIAHVFHIGLGPMDLRKLRRGS